MALFFAIDILQCGGGVSPRGGNKLHIYSPNTHLLVSRLITEAIVEIHYILKYGLSQKGATYFNIFSHNTHLLASRLMTENFVKSVHSCQKHHLF